MVQVTQGLQGKRQLAEDKADSIAASTKAKALACHAMMIMVRATHWQLPVDRVAHNASMQLALTKLAQATVVVEQDHGRWECMNNAAD